MMKHTTFTLVLLFLLGTLNAQISITPDDLSYDTRDGEIHVEVDVMNTTSEIISIYWMYEEADDFPDMWLSQVCDVNLCYTAYPIKCHPEKPIVINAFAVSKMKIDVTTEGQEGDSWAVLIFYSDPDLTNEIARTLMPPLSTNSVKYASTNLYPNPSSDYFNISEDADVAKVEVYSMSGQIISTYAHASGKSYDISSYEKGLYLVTLYDKNGDLMKSMQLRK